MWEAELPPAKEEALDYMRKAAEKVAAGEYAAAAGSLRGAAACIDHCARIKGQS
tara:strand:+ start:482 stop:643 length:162 start_codon:yes stop_codon:yes gene_type:complete